MTETRGGEEPGDWTVDREQIQWALDYIKKNYGTEPCGDTE